MNPVTLRILKDHTFSMARMYPVAGTWEARSGKYYLHVKNISAGKTVEEGLRYLAPAPEAKFLTAAKVKAPIAIFPSKDGKTLKMPWCPAAPEVHDVQFFRSRI